MKFEKQRVIPFFKFIGRSLGQQTQSGMELTSVACIVSGMWALVPSVV